MHKTFRTFAVATLLLAPALAQPGPDQTPSPAPPAPASDPVSPRVASPRPAPASDPVSPRVASPPPANTAQPEDSPGEAPASQRGPDLPQVRGRFGGPTQGVFYTGEDEGFGFGSVLPDPTAFQGANRADPVLQGSRFIDNTTLSAHYGHYLTPDQRLMLTAAGGFDLFSVDADYSFIPEGTPGYFSAYINHTQSLTSAFRYGNEVGLPGGNNEPYLYRTNVGFGYTSDPQEKLSVSGAILYERLNIHDGAFSSRVAPFDRLGNPLTLNAGGTDERMLLRVNGLYMDLDHIQFPTEGDKFRFFGHQTLGLAGTPGGMTQFGANYTHFARLGDPTLIFNVQAGHSLGTVAPYDSFVMGGAQSVRGFQLGELGGGTSFLQTTLELRVPIGEAHLFGSDIPFRFTTFVDYGSALGTQDNVYGTPAVVRSKPDSGFSYGAGLQAVTNFGLMRLEAGFAAGGRSQVFFILGDRY